MFVEEYPRLRPLEAVPDPKNHRVILRDPTQLAAGMLVVGLRDLALITLLDGSRSRVQIQAEYARQTGQLLVTADLEALLAQLGQGGFLDGAAFETYYAELVEEYLAKPYRPLRDLNGYGAPAERLPDYLDGALAEAELGSRFGVGRRPYAIVTPHLDFPRGRSCYAEGYAALRSSGWKPRRVVILGTNHFGRSRSLVATTRDFETPWGIVPTDRAFLELLQAECTGSLFPYELDHLREHSIELQVTWLHHVLGNGFAIVPVLCPDPSAPRGTRPGDPNGVDLREFSHALGRLIRDDPESTLIVASADLSHVGGYFGDETALDEGFLGEVRSGDEAALSWVDRNDPEGFRAHMASTGNPTRVCSVGCLYALMTALGSSIRAERLRYHQAVTPELENAVTCAAYAFGEW